MCLVAIALAIAACDATTTTSPDDGMDNGQAGAAGIFGNPDAGDPQAGAGGRSGEGGEAGTSSAGVGGNSGSSGGGGSGITGKTSGEKIDLLFMIDNSNTMRDEQEALRAQFPRLIERLLAGTDLDGDGTLDHRGARDLHLGVVSSDMGLPGINGIMGCTGLGDDGMLEGTANPEIAGCSATNFNPPFITYVHGMSDPAQVATDFSCIATLGTEGCGFEMQLESVLKAVWPGADQNVRFVTDPTGFGATGQAGPGFPNGTFIRDSPDDLSLIAIVLVTDEEDCSSNNMAHFQLSSSLPADSPLHQQGLNTRCHYESLKPEPNNLFDVDRYVAALRALRPGNEPLVIFGAIAGVPPELVTDSALAEVDFGDVADTNAFYDRILAHERMQEVIDDKDNEDPQDDTLVPSCENGTTSWAYPPRRIVQVARGFGPQGFVQSICQSDFAPAMDLLITRIAQALEPLE